MRHVSAAGLAFLALAVGCAGHAGRPAQTANGPSSVATPSAATSLGPSRESSAQRTAASAHVASPWCRAVDLQQRRITGPGGLAGELSYGLLATNVTARACRVAGFATESERLSTSGRWGHFAFYAGSPLDGPNNDHVYVIAPGMGAYLNFIADHSNGYSKERWRAVRLRFAHMAGSLTWRGDIGPDSGVGLGPIRAID